MRGARSSLRDDQDKLKDALAKIKSENRKLRKENQQLKKLLARFSDLEIDQKEESENKITNNFKDLRVEEASTSRDEKGFLYCPTCQDHSIIEIPMGLFTLRKCNSCNYKRRITA